MFYPTIHTVCICHHYTACAYVSVHAHAFSVTHAVNFDLTNSNGDAREDGLRGAVGSPATERVLWLGTVVRRGTCTLSRDKVGCVFCACD